MVGVAVGVVADLAVRVAVLYEKVADRFDRGGDADIASGVWVADSARDVVVGSVTGRGAGKWDRGGYEGSFGGRCRCRCRCRCQCQCRCRCRCRCRTCAPVTSLDSSCEGSVGSLILSQRIYKVFILLCELQSCAHESLYYCATCATSLCLRRCFPMLSRCQVALYEHVLIPPRGMRHKRHVYATRALARERGI